MIYNTAEIIGLGSVQANLSAVSDKFDDGQQYVHLVLGNLVYAVMFPYNQV